MYVTAIKDREAFEHKAAALGAVVRVLRTTRMVPVRKSGNVIHMQPSVAIEYSFVEPTDSGETRWVYRERWMPDPDTGLVDLSRAMVEEKPPNVNMVMTRRSGSF